MLGTIDGGENWEVLDSGTDDDLYSLFFIDDLNGWIARPTGLLRTTDGGREWQALSDINEIGRINDIYFFNHKSGFAVGGEEVFEDEPVWGIGMIWCTEDGGETWTLQDSSADHSFNAIAFIDSLHGWAVGYKGTAYITENGGITWQLQDLKTEESFYEVYFITPEIGWIMGTKGTILTTSKYQDHTIVIENSRISLPSMKYSLYNYPNPFNSSTTITFELAQSTHIVLSIHNLLGQKIVTLSNEQFPSGFHRITWDGTNATRQPVASGTYIYKLNIENTYEARRMLLIR